MMIWWVLATTCLWGLAVCFATVCWKQKRHIKDMDALLQVERKSTQHWKGRALDAESHLIDQGWIKD